METRARGPPAPACSISSGVASSRPVIAGLSAMVPENSTGSLQHDADPLAQRSHAG